MERGTAHNTPTPAVDPLADSGSEAVGLLAMVEAQGGDLGAVMLRLAHRAAAQHRYQTAMQHQPASVTVGHDTGDAR